jgi:hypothetical protein
MCQVDDTHSQRYDRRIFIEQKKKKKKKKEHESTQVKK